MLIQIRSFLAVAEEGSLHRAATRLRISQPALSRQMQALESEVGGRLLERASTGVKLTSGGRALLDRMRPVLASYDSAMLQVRRQLRGESDQLRVGFIASAVCEYLDQPLKRVRKEHPKIKLKLLDLSPGEQIAALRRGEIDIGLTDASGDVLSREFYTQRLKPVASVVALPVQHALADSKSIRLSQLKNEVFVAGSDEHVPGSVRRLVSICRQYGKFRPKLSSPVNTLVECLEMVANDNTVSIIPDFRPHPRTPGVTMIPLAEKEATWDLLLIWQRGKTAGALRTLVNAMLEPRR